MKEYQRVPNPLQLFAVDSLIFADSINDSQYTHLDLVAFRVVLECSERANNLVGTQLVNRNEDASFYFFLYEVGRGDGFFHQSVDNLFSIRMGSFVELAQKFA